MRIEAPGLSALTRCVRDLIGRSPVTCAPPTPASEIARIMGRERVGAVVVVDGSGRPVGIVTDRDLRAKVVARAADATATPAAALMSAPLVTVSPAAFVFDALLEMVRRQIHHLVIVDGGRLTGVLSSTDLLALQAAHPVTLVRRIVGASSVAALAELAGQVTVLVRRLFDEGATAYDLGQIVAELNDRIVVRALGLVAAALADIGEELPDVPFCWLAFGSEARREQTLRTDQDNGLVYGDPPAGLEDRAAAYYGRFASAAIAALVAVGFPQCTGGFMASNPSWCRPLGAWRDFFLRAMRDAETERLLPASILFDLRPLTGALDLGGGLRDLVRTEAPASRPFLARLARDVATQPVPRTLLGGVAVIHRGPHRGTVDVKGAGVMQLVGAARVDALDLGLVETNTIDRIRQAGARGRYSEAEVREIGDAYQHLARLRLAHQLAQIDRGAAPDNFIVPGELSRADAVLLREALRTVGHVQEALRQRYATDFVQP